VTDVIKQMLGFLNQEEMQELNDENDGASALDAPFNIAENGSQY